MRVVSNPLALLCRRFARRASCPRTDHIDPHCSADAEHPVIESRSRLELTEGFERFFCGQLCKVVCIGRVSGQGVGKTPQTRPYRGQLGIERQGRHCTSYGMKRASTDVSSGKGI